MHLTPPRRAHLLALLLAVVLGAGVQACAHRPDRRQRENARISYDVGITAFERGDTREALRALLSAVRSDPKLPEAHHALGLVYHASGKEDLALQHYREALALRPRFSDAQNNMGVLLLDMGRYDEAIVAFEAALSDMLYATPTLAKGNLGWALYQNGNVADGRARIAAAISSDPGFCRGYEWLMRIALDLDDGEEALAQGRRLYGQCLDNPKVQASLPADYRREMDYYLALAHLKVGYRADAVTLLLGCSDVGDAVPPAGSVAARCAAALEALH